MLNLAMHEECCLTNFLGNVSHYNDSTLYIAAFCMIRSFQPVDFIFCPLQALVFFCIVMGQYKYWCSCSSYHVHCTAVHI